MQSEDADGTYVGSTACAACHAVEYAAWRRSHHALAMQPADADSVLGDFSGVELAHPQTGQISRMTRRDGQFIVSTDGPSGALEDFRVTYTFGVAPLQQYLVEMPDGRLQTLDVTWDARDAEKGGQRWYHLRASGSAADDPLHWTRHGANWNFMCADCHSTAVRKAYDAVQGTYATSFEEVSVGCEACHGPGSLHRQNPWETSLPAIAEPVTQVPVCARCHSRRGQLADGYRPGDAFLDFYQPVLLDEGLYHVDGQILDEVYVYGSFLQSSMHQRGVTCSNCHEAHSGELVLPGDGVCTQCHSPAGNARFPNAPRGDFAAVAHHLHETDSAGSRCVACHMPATTYMGVDPRRDHSFRVPRPDLTAALGVPNACAACHEESADWLMSALDAAHGVERKPHFAEVLATARRGAPEAEAGLVELSRDASQPGIVRATALALMVSYEHGASAQQIQARLGDDDPLVRVGALRGAQRFAPVRRWRLISPLLNDPLLAVRVEAVQSLLSVYGELTLAQRQRMSAALDDYRQVLAFNADAPEALTNQAVLQMTLGEPAAAEAALARALEINPQWVPALVNLADLRRATGRDLSGGELLEAAVRLAPRQPDVLVARALWLVRQNQPEAALVLLEEAWRLDEANADTAYVYAVALNSLGQPVVAVQVLDRTLALRSSERLRQLAASIRAGR